ncbi:MAG TPA: hypothetical protein VIA07_03025, partial [Desulfuromonadales bacterium]
MKTDVDEPGEGTIAGELAQKIEAMLQCLGAEDEARLGLYKSMASLLAAHAPYSRLVSPSPAQLAE